MSRYMLWILWSRARPRMMIKRTHPGLVKRMFEMECLRSSTAPVEIKTISRQTGARTKMAVWSEMKTWTPWVHRPPRPARRPTSSRLGGERSTSSAGAGTLPVHRRGAQPRHRRGCGAAGGAIPNPAASPCPDHQLSPWQQGPERAPVRA